MLKEIGCPEVFRNVLVETGNYLVDRFLPAGLGVFASLNSFEELTHRLRHHIYKRSGHLIDQIRKIRNFLHSCLVHECLMELTSM